MGSIPVVGSLNEASLLAGAVTSYPLGPLLSLRGFAEAGIGYGTLSTGMSAPYGAARLGGGLEMSLSQDFSLGMETSWTQKLGLYGALVVTLGMGYRLPVLGAGGQQAPRIRLLEFSSLDIKNIFPILRSWYDEHPLGTVKIVNTGKEAARDVKVSFIIRQYMDSPKECALIKRLEPGQVAEVNLYGLFNDKILAVTEPTKVSAEVSLENGNNGMQVKNATVLVYDRNALTWADDRKAAAFVSSKDPWVLDLSGNIIASVKSLRNPELSKNMQTAIALHEGLRAFGLGYVLSPNRPFAQAVLNPETVDSLKFPRQTMAYRSGDCADLSVLYASCFEAVGIETAFVTVPGHIFMAVDLGLKPEELKVRSMDEREFIVLGDTVWLPIETTMRDSDFIEVWKKAALQWREASAKGVAAVFPVHEAWKIYPPVGLPSDGSAVVPPHQDVISRVFKTALARAVDAELGARLASLSGAQSKGQVSLKSLNERGVLYGKYGRFDDAQRDFQTAAKDGYLPSIINLGNIAYMKADLAGALKHFQDAAKLSPDNARVLANLARTASALGKTEIVNTTLTAMRKLDPAVADQYASLAAAGNASGSRAAAQDEGGLLWF